MSDIFRDRLACGLRLTNPTARPRDVVRPEPIEGPESQPEERPTWKSICEGIAENARGSISAIGDIIFPRVEGLQTAERIFEYVTATRPLPKATYPDECRFNFSKAPPARHEHGVTDPDVVREELGTLQRTKPKARHEHGTLMVRNSLGFGATRYSCERCGAYAELEGNPRIDAEVVAQQILAGMECRPRVTSPDTAREVAQQVLANSRECRPRAAPRPHEHGKIVVDRHHAIQVTQYHCHRCGEAKSYADEELFGTDESPFARHLSEVPCVPHEWALANDRWVRCIQCRTTIETGHSRLSARARVATSIVGRSCIPRP